MDENENEIAEVAPKPKQKRKPRKLHKYAKKEKPPWEVKTARHGPTIAGVTFPGLTENDGAAACSTSGCVISGNAICGHPRKGGLQGDDHAAKQRLQAAQKQLGMNAVERKYA